MKLDAVLLVSRNNIYSEKSINSFLKSKIKKGIKKSISIPKEVYKLMSQKIPKDDMEIIVLEKKPQRLWHHMQEVSAKITTDYLIFLHDDDLIHENFLLTIWEILLKEKPSALASRVNFIGKNDKSLKHRQYIPRKKIARLTDKKILMKYFSPFERSVIFPTIAYKRDLLLSYWSKYKRHLGFGEDVRLVHFFTKNGRFLENQDSRLFKYRMYEGQQSTKCTGYSRLIIIAWLKNIKLNFLYKLLFLFLAKLQYTIYSKSNFSKNNFLGKLILKLRPSLVWVRRGGKENK